MVTVPRNWIATAAPPRPAAQWQHVAMSDRTSTASTSIWLVGPNFVDRLAAPPVATWGPVGAASAAWATAHLVAATIALLSIGPQAVHEPWRGAALLAWLLCTSGLVLRIAGRIVSGNDTQSEITLRQFSPNTMGGAYLVLTQLTYEVLRPLGTAATIGFVGLVVITLGARTAGLDAWDGKVFRPGHYLRLLIDPRSIPPVLLGVASTAALFWFFSVTVDRAIPAGPGLEWLVGPDFSRRRQFLQFMVAVAIVTLPALAVCEGIAAVARFHARLHELLAEEARRVQRAHFARRVHDRALGKIDTLYRMLPDDAQRSALVDLEGELRLIQCDYRQGVDEMPVGNCLHRGLELANRARLHVLFQPDPSVARVSLGPDVADAFERSLLILVSNSVKAGALHATLELREDVDRVRLQYADDAGGYDPAAALDKRGGLFDLQQQLASIGGDLMFESAERSTRSLVLVPA